MKKLLTFFLTALLTFSVGWATEVTFNATTDKGSVTANGTTANGDHVTKDGVTVTSSNGPMGNGSNYRVYQNGTLTVTSTAGNITKIEMTFTASGTSNYGPSKISATGYSYSGSVGTWQGTAASTVTFSASAQARITNIVVTVSGGAAPQENWYRKVTSTSDLAAGKKYIIVNEANGVGMGELNSNRFGTGVTGLTFDNNRVDIGGTNVMEMTLGGSSNNWTFQMPNGNYLSNSSSSNNTFFSSTSVQTSSTDITKWTITPSADACAIQSNYVTAQYIRFNSSGLFGTYGITAQSPVALYVEDDGSTVETCATPTFSPAAGTYNEAQDVTISTTTSGASIYYTTDNSTPSATNGTLYTGAINVSSTTTIKAIAVKTGNNDSQVAEATYTISSGGGSGTIYRKVTSTDALTTGDYLIVYEGDNVAFDGSLVELNLDMANNTKSVTISNQTIETAENIYFTYNATAGTLKSASGYYIGKINTSNGMNISATEPYTHTITIDNSGNANITSTNVTNGPSLRFNSASNQKRFRYYGSGQQAIQLYKKDSTDPTLLATPTTLALTDIPYDGSSTSGTFTLTGTYLTQNVTMTFSGAEGFSIDPSTSPIVPVDGSVSQEYTVTYNGNSTSEVTATVTFTCGDLTETVTVTAKKATPPPVSITISPNTQTFSDAAPAELTITGEYVSGNINASLANNTDWYLNPNTFGNTGGTATVTYNGRALSASNTVTASASGATDATATVNYVADLYIVTDNGVTGDWHFDGQYSVQMTNNNGVYTGVFTATTDNTFILFARKTGDGVNWNTRYVFGPNSDGDWWLPTSGNGSGTIDTNDDDPIKIQGAGTYVITIDANAGTFTITKRDLGGDEFTLVTATEDVTTDSEYVLVYSNIAAMGKTLSGASSGYLNPVTTGFEVEVDVVTLASDSEVNVFTLSDSGDEGYFYLKMQDGGKYIGTNGNNLALADEANGDAYKWSITIANDLAVIQNLGNSRFLAYNTSSPRFTTYASITSGSAQQYAALYKRSGTVGPVAPATPVITPDSGNYPGDQEVSISCSTTGATIYYILNGGETQTYTAPFNVDLDEEHTEATVEAWAVKDELTSEHVTATYTYKSLYVNSIEEFLALENGDSAYFRNPVVVLFDYSQNSSGGQEYIWVKDRTGYTQFFIAPQFDAASVADPQYEGTYGEFVPKYENGDVIPGGFKVKKEYYANGQYYQGQCYGSHSSFEEANEKALADPEQVTLSELLANPAAYNNRYLYINKLQVTGFVTGYGTASGLWTFYIAADEDGDGTAEVADNSSLVGYNKYNSPAWKNKNGDVVGVDVPEDSKFYNVKFIFQKWSGGYEIMPIEFTEWEETSLRLEDLVQVGELDHPYTISNQLHATAVTWDGDRNMFAIFAKDDHMYASKRYPATGQDTYLIRYETGTFINEVEQEDYDQSNWIEILIPSTFTEVTSKTEANAYQTKLGELQDKYEGMILKAATVTGTYVDQLNPTILVTSLPEEETASTYTPNIYCTANFLMENLDSDGAQGNDGNYFMMDAKPHEFCKVVWAYYDNGNGNYFVIPAREGNTVNGHGFHGSFMANMSLSRDVQIYYDYDVVSNWILDSNDDSFNGQQFLYSFDAVVRKNPNYSTPASGAPRRILPGTGDFEQTPAYIVYPLISNHNDPEGVVGVKEVLGNKTIESVHYYNLMGMEGKTPFEGINIVVTRYTDGSTSTIKVMK